MLYKNRPIFYKSYRLHGSPQSKIKVFAMLSERERKGAKIQVARFLDFICINLVRFMQVAQQICFVVLTLLPFAD